MQISSQDRNTGITIAVVLIVCTASLIAIGSSLFRLITPSLNTIGNVLGARVRVVTVDYNFTVPASGVQTAAPIVATTDPQTIQVQGNFDVPDQRPLPTIWRNSIGKQFGLAQDVKNQGYALVDEGSDQINFQLSIPSAGLTTPVFQGNNGFGNLAKGAWLHPRSQTWQVGEAIILCERSIFGPQDVRSCLYLDNIQVGDEVIVRTEVTEYKYTIVGKNIFAAADTTIYQSASDTHTLKIVTTHPIGNNQQRLVLLAAPVAN